VDWFTSTNELHERFYAPYGLDRRQAQRFAEAVARGEFEEAETTARRAFPSAGTTDLAI
jgi:hypothetical protein